MGVQDYKNAPWGINVLSSVPVLVESRAGYEQRIYRVRGYVRVFTAEVEGGRHQGYTFVSYNGDCYDSDFF